MSKQFAHVPVVEAQPIGLREVVLNQSQVESDTVALRCRIDPIEFSDGIAGDHRGDGATGDL